MLHKIFFQYRHQAFAVAIRNAQDKAQSVSRTLGLSLKAPLSVTEDSCELKVCSSVHNDARPTFMGVVVQP